MNYAESVRVLITTHNFNCVNPWQGVFNYKKAVRWILVDVEAFIIAPLLWTIIALTVKVSNELCRKRPSSLLRLTTVTALTHDWVFSIIKQAVSIYFCQQTTIVVVVMSEHKSI